MVARLGSRCRRPDWDGDEGGHARSRSQTLVGLAIAGHEVGAPGPSGERVSAASGGPQCSADSSVHNRRHVWAACKPHRDAHRSALIPRYIEAHLRRQHQPAAPRPRTGRLQNPPNAGLGIDRGGVQRWNKEACLQVFTRVYAGFCVRSDAPTSVMFADSGQIAGHCFISPRPCCCGRTPSRRGARRRTPSQTRALA